MPITNQQLPLEFTLATDRDDAGKTDNYTVYACNRQMSVKNGRGETVVKNAIMGGNGTIYIGHELAGEHHRWVLMPFVMYEQLAGAAAPKAAPKKGKGKK